jgi:hypothetical protein
VFTIKKVFLILICLLLPLTLGLKTTYANDDQIESGTCLDSLPLEVLEEIISYLGPKDLSSFGLTAGKYQSLIRQFGPWRQLTLTFYLKNEALQKILSDYQIIGDSNSEEEPAEVALWFKNYCILRKLKKAQELAADDEELANNFSNHEYNYGKFDYSYPHLSRICLTALEIPVVAGHYCVAIGALSVSLFGEAMLFNPLVFLNPPLLLADLAVITGASFLGGGTVISLALSVGIIENKKDALKVMEKSKIVKLLEEIIGQNPKIFQQIQRLSTVEDS